MLPLIGVWKNEADGGRSTTSALPETTASKTGKCRTDGDDGQSETATVTGNANGSRGDGDLNELVLVMS